MRLTNISNNQLQVLEMRTDDFRRLVDKKNRFKIKDPNRLSVTAGRTSQNNLGIRVHTKYPFSADTATLLTPNALNRLNCKGVVHHSKNKDIVYVMSRSDGPNNWTLPPWQEQAYRGRIVFAYDAIDIKRGKMAGNFSHEISFSDGTMRDLHNPFLEISPFPMRFFPEATLSLADLNELKAGFIGQKKRGLPFELTAFSSLLVDPKYRNSGEYGYLGIADILLTSAMRIAAEQFLIKAYIMSLPAEAVTDKDVGRLTAHFEKKFGAVKSGIRALPYSDNLIISFCGEDGKYHALNILSEYVRLLADLESRSAAETPEAE